MKTILYLAFCVILTSAKNPIGDLSSALKLLNLQNLSDFDGQYDLTSSYTFSNSDESVPSEQILVKGNYNLVTVVDGQTKTKIGSFENTTTLSTDAQVNITGSGTFSARGDASAETGSFNGASISEFAVAQEVGQVNGIRSEEFSAVITGKIYNGYGHTEVDTWQDVNTSSTIADYKFNGQTNDDFREFSGNSTYIADFTNADSNQYTSIVDSVFAGTLEGNTYYLAGVYNLAVFNSTGDEVYKKTGPFIRNGTDPFIPDLADSSHTISQ